MQVAGMDPGVCPQDAPGDISSASTLQQGSQVPYVPTSPSYFGAPLIDGSRGPAAASRKRPCAEISGGGVWESRDEQHVCARDQPVDGCCKDGELPGASASPLESCNNEVAEEVQCAIVAELEGDQTAGKEVQERPVSPEARSESCNMGVAGEVQGNNMEEDDGASNVSPTSKKARSASVELDASSNTSCDSAPFTTTMAADRLRALGYPVFSVELACDRNTGKKDVSFPCGWQKTTLANGTVRDRHNGLAINTTTCDLLGLDIDLQDRGMESWDELQRAHGVESAPTVQTGSGGLHLYYSHSKSIAAGLSDSAPTHFVKLYLEQEGGALSKIGIDMRGKGKSSCLIAPGSSYVDKSGERVGYELTNRSELPPLIDLPPLPSFLIDLVNRRTSLEARWKEQKRQEERGSRAALPRSERPSQPAVASSEPDLASPELQGEVVSALETLLSTWGDNTSVFSDAKPSSTGVGVVYNFRNGPEGRAVCPYFAAHSGGVHDSNNFALMRRGAEILYLCYGERCKATSRSRAIRLGMLPLPVAAAFGDSQPLNSERNHLYSNRALFPLSFLRENLNVMKGDVGCAIILERLYFQTGLKFAFTPTGSYFWTGRCWAKDESGGRIMRVMREELTKIQSAYMRDCRAGRSPVESIDLFDGLESVGPGGEIEGEGDETDPPVAEGEQGGREKERLVNINFNAKMSNIVSTCKDYFFQPDFQAQLDVQKDFRAAANGVIDLRSGRLLPHHPRFMNSRVIDWPFPRYGINYSRGEVVRFLEDVMHLAGEDGSAALEHLQVLLGYGLTGHTSNQVLAIFVGEGSAGKSLLLALLRKLLGPAYRDVRKEIVVNAKGQRAANKGAASPTEAGLAGALLAVVEETDKSDTLDEAGMKKLTGSDIITARPLFKDFVTFTATVLLILCTNYLPKTDKTWSVALRRRLQLTCFVKRYFSPHEKGFDPSNPLHGAVDTQLLTRLSTLPNMQELLAWLVAGAVKWYGNGQQLYPMPKRSEEALRDYEESNDDFEKFVLNSCVTQGEDLFISTTDAVEVFNHPQRKVDGDFVGNIARLNNKTIKSVMNNHGFKGPGKPSELGLGVKYAGVQDWGYRGLALKPKGEFLGESS